MKDFSQTFPTLTAVANLRSLKSIAAALCFGITICFTGIANAETDTYSWTGTILSVAVDDGTGTYAGTQVGDTFSGTFTYDPDVANIDGFDTSDGDSVIEPGDVWVEYFLGSDSATLTDGMIELIATEVALSITTDDPVTDPDGLDFLSHLFGKEVASGTLVDVWGLDFGDGIFEFEIAYASLVNMQDDLSFRPTPPWSPPGPPDDPDNQIAFFKISENDGPSTHNETFSAYGTITIAQVQQFGDVPPDYWAFSFIDKLAGSGITAGCGNDNYCPEDPVTRAQMAVFLERGMNGSGFSPPAATGNVFLDIAAGDFAAAFIEQFFLDGITSGCGGNNYCPNDAVTRAQMAVFLLRAKHGAGYAPPPANGIFTDAPLGSFAVAWIEQLAAEGITAGCGGGNYCPDNPVTRAQMAVFLVRTFGL